MNEKKIESSVNISQEIITQDEKLAAMSSKIDLMFEEYELMRRGYKTLNAFVEINKDNVVCMSIGDFCRFVNKHLHMSDIIRFKITEQMVIKILQEDLYYTELTGTNTYKVIPTVKDQHDPIGYNPYVVDHQMFEGDPSRIFFTQLGVDKLTQYIVKRAFIHLNGGDKEFVLKSILDILTGLKIQLKNF